MQITITARHFELTKAIRDYVETSCLKVKKYFDHIIHVHVTLALENNRNICELTLHASRFNLQSQAEEMDMYLSIDNALDKMEAQIKKLKDRVTDHQKKALKEQFNDFSRATEIQVNTESRARKTLKTKRVVPEIMDVQEALEKIDELKEEFLIFKNVETDRLNVLVKRDAEHYKLFEP
ncbi:MAG: ribosome-associated translation inhibitor RaiA [Candidatus Cloacimonetes bacterium]|nr:ribosome-associated translation inhibitor RaiA [Candidatus Cloacimonadota bacterium]HNZ07154.1 ribosome-associated translation inhibitor RaiA [Candidatus Cloacimonadota bacterium]HOH78076.1 ribosome-associated translation inhibitor RaiA [Candidatus Cloacimonadota bacterium]HPN40371.1 ribosome-associated translation inhibitor RaiA [Candidatus Cloacimonadota bacterium]